MTAVRRVFVTALLLSVVHYIDNTVRFDDYTGGKDGFVTQAMIPISWVLFTAAGVAGYRALLQGNRGLGASLLGVYSVSGLIGILHYTTVSPSDFSAFQNTFIGLDFLAGLAVFVMAVRLAVSRPPTTTGRFPAGSASR
ncbi:MAG TPA: hypothetical protein VG034_01925 [Acidimicrobiia bacterium]|jgi:hypothetical protein|nr:hypothetical protein [Acidimicrobiia bacterium]